MNPKTILCLSLVAVLAPFSTPQTDVIPGQTAAPKVYDDEPHRQARIALTGTLGFAPLPPVTADSPRDTIFFADRAAVGQGPTPPGAPAVISDGFLPAGAGGTGTAFPEIFKYQLGDSYNPLGTPHPLIVAYHGFGFSANSVIEQSTIDELANTYGWVMLSVTGIDDQLFGAPIVQQNVEAAIQWMLDTFNCDADRIYMVGFSMGAGIAANFASRHRDPGGIMIAGLGLVSPTLDWTQEYSLGGRSLQTWMENPFNFDGPPATNAFNYEQASALKFDTGSYPPLPGTVDGLLSMSSNLEGIPTYITYDSGDTILHVPGVADAMEGYLLGVGSVVQKRVVTGTVDPDFPWIPAPHSWAVLDEAELFAFLDGLGVERFPDAFHAQQDLNGAISWAESRQNSVPGFTYMDGTADALAGRIIIENVQNATEIHIDPTAAGLSGISPLRVTATSADANGFDLRIENVNPTPSYMLHVASNELVTTVDSDPFFNALIKHVPGNTTLDMKIIHDPEWVTGMVSGPNPVSLGGTATIFVDAPPSSVNTWFILTVFEARLKAKGIWITAYPGPPALLFFLPLNGAGDISFPISIPNDPIFQGARLPMQCLTLNGAGDGDSASNLWGFYIE